MIERSDERIKETGEVFTPAELVNEVLDRMDIDWDDNTKTFIDPACGDGNFLVEVNRRLLEAGHDKQHILENMIFGIDLMPDNVERCIDRLKGIEYNHNIVQFNTLEWDGHSWPPKKCFTTLEGWFNDEFKE